MVEGLWIVIF